MKKDKIEVRTMDYVVEIDNVTGGCKYRKSDYKNKNNWINVEGEHKELIKSLADWTNAMEESREHLESEVYEYERIPMFLEIYRDVKDCDEGEVIYIYESHMGGYYHTSEDLSYEELHCEQCGDSDNYEWSGTKKELYDIVKYYLD